MLNMTDKHEILFQQLAIRTLSGDTQVEGVANGQEELKGCAINVECVDDEAAQNEGYYDIHVFFWLFHSFLTLIVLSDNSLLSEI